jgi:hypothetical protein
MQKRNNKISWKITCWACQGKGWHLFPYYRAMVKCNKCKGNGYYLYDTYSTNLGVDKYNQV